MSETYHRFQSSTFTGTCRLLCTYTVFRALLRTCDKWREGSNESWSMRRAKRTITMTMEVLTSLTSSLQSLFKINSFDKWVTKTHRRLYWLIRWLLCFNEWKECKTDSKERKKKNESFKVEWVEIRMGYKPSTLEIVARAWISSMLWNFECFCLCHVNKTMSLNIRADNCRNVRTIPSGCVLWACPHGEILVSEPFIWC